MGGIKLKDLRNDMIQKFINELISKGLGASMISYTFHTLHSSLEKAVDIGLIAKNPSKKIALPTVESKKKRILSKEEQQVFIKEAKFSFYGNLYIFMLATGLRIGEAIALTWEDIDFENEIVRVNKTMYFIKDPDNKEEISHMVINPPKTKSGNRSVPLLPCIIEMLRKSKLKQEAKGKFSKNKEYNKHNNVFCNKRGKPIRQDNARDVFRKLVTRIGFEDLSLHSLRHIFCTRGLESGIELRVMQELLGHSSLTMTADLYTHVLPDKKRESVMKLEDTIKI